MESSGDINHIKRSLARALAEKEKDAKENKIRYYLPACFLHFPQRCPGDCVSSKHASFHRSLARNRFVFGGNSSGKTILGLTEMVIRMCYNVHPYNGLQLPHPAFHRIEFESFRNWESYYLPLLKEWIPRSMLVGNSWSDAYNVKFSLLRLKNGDSVDALSYDMAVDKFESATINDIWADEKMPEEIYDANLSRLLRTNGYFWNTVTPINGMPWIMTRVWGVDTADTKCWVVDMDENPYISKEAKTRVLEQMSPEEREARKSGRPMQFQGVVYPEISESVHITDNKPGPHWPIYMAMDAHPRKPAQMVWVACGPGDSLMVVDELEMKGTPKELADSIFRKEYELRQWIGGPSMAYKGVKMRYIDLSALTLDSDIQDHYDLLAEFKKVGLPFQKANRSSIGYQATKQYLYFDKKKDISSFNRPMLTFAKGRVPRTYFSMTHIIYDEYKSRQGRDPKERVKDWAKDPADCVRYICVQHPKHEMNYSPTSYGDNACYTSR